MTVPKKKKKKDKHSGTRQVTAATHVSSPLLSWIDISCARLEEVARGTQNSGQGEVHPRRGAAGLDARAPRRVEAAA